MLSYAARIKRDGKTFMVSFPDFPGVYSQGDDIEDAARHGRDALETALYFLVREGSALPAASEPRRGQRMIEVSPGFAVKLFLVREVVTQGISQADLARRLRVTPQEVTRLLDLRHKTKIDSLAAALHALNKRLEISLAA